jgi:hypothetical protein
MGIFSRMFGAKPADSLETGANSREAQSATIQHLRSFVAGHQGCEAFIEPPTRVTQTTMVIVADTGEWTRRRVPDTIAGRKVAQELKIPVFDVNLSGYPSRMREWNEKNRKGLK